MYYKANNTLKRLSISREAIEIVQTDIYLNDVMARFGYGEEELATGLSLQANADVLFSRQDIEYGNQRVTTEALKAQYREVRNRLRDDRRIVGAVLDASSGIGRLLRLSIRLGNTYEAVLSQALHFYREIQNNEPIKAQLAAYSYTDEVLTARIAEATLLSAAMKKKQVQVGEAQVITAQFREAMGELDDWMKQFIGVARMAFRNDPKQLKKLGIYVKPPRITSDEEETPAETSSDEPATGEAPPEATS